MKSKEEIDAWIMSVTKRDPAGARQRALASLALGKKSAAPGLVGTKLGDKYVGEQIDQSFRGDQNSKTRYFADGEKENSRLQFGQGGEVSSKGGTLDGKLGFVVDPQTGKTHIFKEGKEGTDAGDNKDVFLHHSSPLSGGDVAGAGQMEVSGKHIEKITDKSGHYKPTGEFTFQAVRQLNAETLSADIQQRLSRRKSTATKTEATSEKGVTWQGGEAEGPDTFEQLVAAEIQVAREAFFAQLDKEQQEAIDANAKLEEGPERDRRDAAIDMARKKMVDGFRDVARAVEDILRDSAGTAKNPLIDSRVDNTEQPFVNSDPDAGAKYLERKNQNDLKGQYDALIGIIDEKLKKDPAADVSALRKKAEAAEKALLLGNYNPAVNKETSVTLLGKAGMLSEAEYGELRSDVKAKTEAAKIGGTPLSETEIATLYKDGYNKKSAIKQLAQPLGEEKYAELVQQNARNAAAANKEQADQPSNDSAKKAAPKDAVVEALLAAGLKPGDPGAVEQLKKILGEKAAAAIGDSDLPAKIRKYGIKTVDDGSGGADATGFKIGEATSVSLGAQEYLQTGGNEAQIHNKQRVLDEIEKGKPALKEVPIEESKAKQDIAKQAERTDKPPHNGAERSGADALSAVDMNKARGKRMANVQTASQAIYNDPVFEAGRLKQKIEDVKAVVYKKTSRLDDIDKTDSYNEDEIARLTREIEQESKKLASLEKELADL
jgi:hypothetical protein